ncbi:COG3014 family protein [Crenobacter luteus]|uniref:Uncharacterized protein n=1 Tax=Crenobacter luteus TaxID=1452487 RepID=A0A161SHM2_9NEIS|nr:hypothetical protein [Crenobacter luteus]KZE33270.1 hypothetical protein AVW16_08875 [Crenobacter luteus]
MRNPSRLARATPLLACLLLAGCGTLSSHHGRVQGSLDAAGNGQIDAAIASLESSSGPLGSSKDLLYYMELGQLQQLKNDIPASTTSWQQADQQIREWEDDYRVDPGKVIGQIGSVLLNDKTRRYEGSDYEKVMLSTYLTLNHTLSGKLDLARVEIKKTHEREALIKDYRDKEYAKLEDEAKSKNVAQPSLKNIKGYPVETLDDPDVLKLKNGYQNAFSHYLAGYVYEANGETSLAAPGYRQAIELRPGTAILEDGLRGLHSRVRQLKPKHSDVLFVVSSGNAPARRSVTLPLPVTMGGGLVLTPISFPVIDKTTGNIAPRQVVVNGRAVAVSPIVSFDTMSRRALRDDMPGILLRSAVRATVKSLLQKEMNDRAGPLGGLLTNIAAVVTEQADDRMWRSLPEQIAIGRQVLPYGQYTLTVDTPSGPKQLPLHIAQRHTIVPIRIMSGSAYLAQGDMTTPAATIEASVNDKAPAPSKQTRKRS